MESAVILRLPEALEREARNAGGRRRISRCATLA